MNLTKLFKLVLPLFLTIQGAGAYAATESVTYIHTDHLGSPILGRDANGVTVFENDYRPYGERVVQQGEAGFVGYTGHAQDDDLGLTYARARWIDPEVGRFLSPDPVKFASGGMNHFNRYSYANSNPYKYTDPDGRAVEVGVAGGALLAVGAVGVTYGACSGSASVWCGAVRSVVDDTIDFALKVSLNGDIQFNESGEAAEVGEGASDLPNQGPVSGGVEGAPDVDAGKQGKHVTGHNNSDDGKTHWPEGENGVRDTQEAWLNGTPVKPDGSVRKGRSSSGREVKVHKDSNGRIHGYPN